MSHLSLLIEHVELCRESKHGVIVTLFPIFFFFLFLLCILMLYFNVIKSDIFGHITVFSPSFTQCYLFI